ncbi:Nucleoside triphosphate pyrophosphohydrolase MazG [Bacteroidales bacterium CF]|jgi:XTP/dITP diphosphohydrolase|nr:Nucleoside triphosphate pyrophosphohydrolase MazG [Bacteroidales bacterium CF]NCB97308.1 nucleoside triphosphate pyrophosphohydrolase [Bacteroidia bacterium]
MKKGREEEIRAFVRLLDIMDELREKCPWDREQTTESLRPLTIEETYELSDAIMNSDDFNISKELGDIMLHIVFYAKIGSEKGTFNITDVMDRCSDKLVYRHPHVFAETQVSGARDVIENWEQLKRKEKDGNKTILSGVPSSLPSIVKAYRVQDKVRAVGFDWEKREQVWDKVREEIGEFEVEMKKRFPDGNINKNETVGDEKLEGEFGDLLFSIINAARLYNINPDTALEMTNRKFIRRFGYLESEAQKRGLSLKSMSLQEMDQIWDEAKRLEDN